VLGTSDTDGPALAVYAAVVYDVISATNSSPQTTEINAKARADTLMKWVNLGLLQAGLFVVVAFIAEPTGKKWRPLVGGGTAMILLYCQYVHAKRSGERSDEPGTETYDAPARAF
jgi:hypothetical protein